MTRATSISGTILVVVPRAGSGQLLSGAADAGLTVEHATGPDAAIARIEGGEPVDVVLIEPGLDDPVRVAQRLHSLDRQGAIVVSAEPEGEAELRHALELAPFLHGDVSVSTAKDPSALLEELAAAAARTRARREAAAELKKRRETPPPLSARYLGTLLDSVPIGLVTLDDDGAVIGWNKRAGTMLERPEVEALGTAFAELFADEERARLAELIERLGSAGIEDGGQIFHRAERAFEVTGARFSIRSGEPGTLLILQDVTKREAAIRELRVQKLLSDAQADSALAGIVVRTLDARVERVNRRFIEIWGVEEAYLRRDPAAAREHARSRWSKTRRPSTAVYRWWMPAASSATRSS